MENRCKKNQNLKESPNQSNGLLLEMARINRNEQNIFPWQTYLIEVRSNDHNPPHFHVVYERNDVSFLIETGELYRVNCGDGDFTNLTHKVQEWLNCKSATRPQTNKENALETWFDLHG